MAEYKAIETEVEYEAMLARVWALFDAEPGTPEEDELERLAQIVWEYEKIHYPIGEPDA